VGPADDLAQRGIAPVHALPGVGKNLQDHVSVLLLHKCRKPVTYGLTMTPILKMLFWHIWAYLFFRSGMLTSNVVEAGGFVCSDPSERVPDLQMIFVPVPLAATAVDTRFLFHHAYGAKCTCAAAAQPRLCRAGKPRSDRGALYSTELPRTPTMPIADMRHVVAAIDDRPRHSGGGCTLSKQTPRPAAVASPMGQVQTPPFKHTRKGSNFNPRPGRSHERDGSMNVQRRDLLLLVILAAAAATPASGQDAAPAFGASSGATHGAASIPDFSGLWSHPYWPGFEPPLSGPGPVRNKLRRRQALDPDGRPLPAANAPLVSEPLRLVGDYTNPVLKPQAAEVVKKHGELELGGGAPSPSNQCWPQPVPYIFWNIFGMQMLQQWDRITFLYGYDHQVRYVRMNQPHPAQVTPSWYGDSVGYYDGDTLVIDTVGVKIGPFAMVDMYGTPYTQALHVVERYRLIDYEAAKEAQERGGKENWRVGVDAAHGWVPDPNDEGSGLQLQFIVEDDGVFTVPWSATITYRRPLETVWEEYVCAENIHEYYAGKDTAVPRADKPDF
jgi:hypothetical protein